MTRRTIWIIAIALVALTLGALGFITYFEQVPVKHRSPPDAEALRNPYLALERFMQRMGRPLERHGDARLLDRLPPGGLLILDEQRSAHMTPQRVQQLLAWVQDGGRLIVAPEPSTRPDPLLQAFKLTRFTRPAAGSAPPKTPGDEDGDATRSERESAPAGEFAEFCKPAAKGTRLPSKFSLRLPESQRTLSITLLGPGLCSGGADPEWIAGAPGIGAQLVGIRHGRGEVVFVNHLRGLLNNERIGNEDHAEMIWSLTHAQPDGRVLFLTRLSVPRLFEWLRESAPAALFSATALLLLWLWRIVPRFGPPRPEAAPERRQLRDHLAAIGRYVWRLGGLDHWLAVTREEFLARLNLRHPAIAALPPGEQAYALAKLTGRSTTTITNALHAPAGSPASFTVAMRTLKNLEHSI